jgi:alpha-tubulin suppressor-like RCC1 family protein
VTTKNRKILLPALLSTALVFSLILPAVVAEASDDYNYPVECDVGDWTNIIEVAGGSLHTVGLKSDRTVVATGWNLHYGECNVGG